MIGQRNSIQPPPSVEDLLGAGPEARLGQVDFASPLTADQQGEPATEPVRPRPKSTATLRRRTAPAGVTTPAPSPAALVDEVAEEPEPAAAEEPVDEVVEVEDVEVAPAPVPDPAEDVVDEVEVVAIEVVEEPATVPEAPKPARKTKAKAPKSPKTPKAKPSKPAGRAPVVESATPVILPVAQLDPWAEAEPAVAVEQPTRRMPMDPAEPPAPPVTPARRAPQPAWPARPGAAARSTKKQAVDAPAIDDTGYLSLTVQEVADSAIERLRDAENATLQHLAALEAEAARRAELLTAQAELDAELIRITARREAHAIISAARQQTGASGQHQRDARQLTEISEAVSRFAESVESSLAPLRASRQTGEDLS